MQHIFHCVNTNKQRNTNYELANNDSSVSTNCTVTCLQVVIPSGLGSIRSNGVLYK